MSKIKKTIEDDFLAARKAQDKSRQGALMLIVDALQKKEKEKRSELTDEDALGVLLTLSKQRKEAMELFKTGGREDLVAKESEELKIIESYLPAQMSEEEVAAEVKAAIAATGAVSPKDMGKVMGVLMPKVKGKADGKVVQNLVRTLLGG
ncbi:GatB/YqeY domain-containing protein [bacterium]|nr:MAG: GatB/YqeY domain-containing protein [bacterium]